MLDVAMLSSLSVLGLSPSKNTGMIPLVVAVFKGEPIKVEKSTAAIHAVVAGRLPRNDHEIAPRRKWLFLQL